MEPVNYADLIILATLVIAWCVLHSGMISLSATDYLQKRLGSNFRFYRLFFNLTSFLTLVPVVLFATSVRTQVIFAWTGYARIFQLTLLGIAFLLLFLGGRHYDARQLIGIKQIRDGNSSKLISDKNEFDTSGILGMTRHPWYLAVILLIWSRPLDASVIVVNTILTAYLIVGTYLEEKKLIREFGDKYRTYQKQVSMLIPLKWLTSKLNLKPS
jgi:protein-S-isoprenylcysteine O-methyltransferase Ste14